MRKLMLSFAALALVAAPAAASPNLETLLQKHFDAQGGLDRLKAARSVSFTTIDTVDGKTTKVSVTRARPNLMRYESNGPEGVMVKAFDGQTGWYAKAGKAELMPADKAVGMKSKAAFDDPLIDAEKRGHSVKVVAVEDRSYVIELTLASGDTQRRYIDRTSYLETKRVASWTYEGKAHSKTVTFSDFKKTDGIVTAHAMEWEHDGKKGRSVVESVKWNGRIDVALFAPPKGATVAVSK